MRLQDCRALGIARYLLRVKMCSAVDLNRQLRLDTEEVDNEPAVWMLPPELEAIQPTIAQRVP